jgi:disulfide bond formation protein DsbB
VVPAGIRFLRARHLRDDRNLPAGDCTKIDWTFLGLSIANWSFVCFVAFAVVLLVLLVKPPRRI